MKKISESKAQKIFERVARQHNTSVEDVKREIQMAMLAGMNDPTPEVQEHWKEIPCKGDKPTPEELLAYLTEKMNK